MIIDEGIAYAIFLFICLLLFFVIKEQVLKRAGEENMFRTLNGLKCKKPSEHFLDFLLNRSFTQKVNDFEDRNPFCHEAREIVADKLRKEEAENA